MIMKSRVILITGVFLGLSLLGGTSNVYAKIKKVSVVSRVELTRHFVVGHTTRKAKVTILSSKNKKIGQGKSDYHGNFIIKTKHNLKNKTFKFKVTKKGYISRITLHKKINKIRKISQKPTIGAENQPNIPETQPNTNLNAEQQPAAPIVITKPEVNPIIIKWAKQKVSNAKYEVEEANRLFDSETRSYQSLLIEVEQIKSKIQSQKDQLKNLKTGSKEYEDGKRNLDTLNGKLQGNASEIPDFLDSVERAKKDKTDKENTLKDAEKDLSDLMAML